MTQFLLPPGFRATDGDDNPLAGGYYLFFAGGTSTPKEVFADADRSTSLGTRVDLNAAGAPVSSGNTPVLIYLDTGTYKVELYDADDTLLFTFDDIPGAVEEPEEVTSALPTTPVISKANAYTVVEADRGKLINANPTGGSFAITLPSAVTVGDNWRIGIRHNGTSGTVTILTVLGQAIRTNVFTLATPLRSLGETVWLVSDGSDWSVDAYVPPLFAAGSPIIFQDRTTTPPSNPTAGARYLINGSPSGAWSTLGFVEGYIAEANGNGGWIGYGPIDGYLGYVFDEQMLVQFRFGSWVDLSNITAPNTSALKQMVVADEKAQNTGPGTATTGAWTKATLNTVRSNTITDASLSSDQITLPTGKYFISAQAGFHATQNTQIRLKSTSTSISITSPAVFINRDTGGGAISIGGFVSLSGYFEVAGASETFELQYHCQGAGDLGRVRNISGEVEVYRTVTIIDLTSLQGPQGIQGNQGADGLDAGYYFQWSTATSGDPGSGKIRGNNGTLSSVTEIAVSETDAAGADLAAVVASWGASSSTTSKGRIRIQKEGATQNFAEFRLLSAGTDQGGYWTFPVEYIAHGGVLGNGNDCAVAVYEKGDIGDPGVTVPDPSGLTEISGLLIEDDDKYLVWDVSAGSLKTQRRDGFRIRNRTSTLGNAGYFWHGGGNPAIVHRLSDRLLVGGAAHNSGEAPPNDDDWLETLAPGFATQNAQFASLQTCGMLAGVFGTRTSDWVDAVGGASGLTIGVGSWAINDDTTTAGGAWALYSETHLDDGCLGYGYGYELNIVSFCTGGELDAYNTPPVGMSIGLQLSSGGDYPRPYDSRTPTHGSAAISINDNGAKWHKGIVFRNGGLNTSIGESGGGVAIDMARSNELRWLYAANSVGLTIYSTVNLAGSKLSLIAANGSFGVKDASGNFLHEVRHTTGLSAFQVGSEGSRRGTLILVGNTSGAITVQPQAAAGTYNFNLPTTAGSAGQALTSQGGGGTAMTWTTLGSAASQNTGTSGATLPFLNGANTWSASQIFSLSSEFGAPITIRLNEDGANAGPYLLLYRNSASPAAADLIGNLTMEFNDSAANRGAGVLIQGRVDDPTDTSEDTSLHFWTVVAGSLGARWYTGAGLVVGAPTGGDKGVGTINATAVYDDNTLLTCYVFDQALEGRIDVSKWDGKVPDRYHPESKELRRVMEEAVVDEMRLVPAEHGLVARRERRRVKQAATQWTPIYDEKGNGLDAIEEPVYEEVITPAHVETRRHEPLRKFLTKVGTKYDPTQLESYIAHWQDKKHLTSMPNEEKFDPGKGLSTGEWLQRLVETVELQALHDKQLLDRIKALEAKFQ